MTSNQPGLRAELARRQAAVVAALVAGAPTPPGFDDPGVRAAAAALLRKRAGDVAAAWPLLAAALGPQWSDRFAGWAATRPTQGAFRDGWDFARAVAAERFAVRTVATEHSAASTTAAMGWVAAVAELAEREARWRYDGQRAPRRRRLPCLRRSPGVVAAQLFGQVWVWRK